MELQPVKSSNIKAVGYEQGKLYIQYYSGTYIYEGVTPEIYDALLKASSKGSFVHEQVRNNYPCKKLTEEIK